MGSPVPIHLNWESDSDLKRIEGAETRIRHHEPSTIASPEFTLPFKDAPQVVSPAAFLG